MSIWSSLTWFVLVLVWVGCGQTDNSDAQMQNKEGLQISEDLSVELLAAEPLVVDPVAYTIDAEGYMFIAENRGYPDPATGGQPAKKEGRIARLEDKDGDGIYDSRTEFAGDFTYPNGVLAWKDGIFVTCAPDIWYLRDTNHDGIADERKVVLTGFFDTKTAQIRMSHPTLGLDGWIYVTGGLNGGRIVSPDHPDRDTVSYKSGDGRFNPNTYEFQVTGGKSQFGITMDAFGQRFGCSNRHPVQHIVMEPWYLNRNKQLRYSETVQNVSPVQAEAVVYPISGSAITADFIPRLIGRSHQGSFTSASSVFIYRDQEVLGSDHYSNVFICESAQNLVQRQIMQHQGASFSSQIAKDGVEFLASKDKWFRPVFLGHGPSGGLYVLDMRRKVIDHPAYIPESIRESFDYHSGNDQGRIYRIHHKDHHSKSKIINLNSMGTADLVDVLESDLAWHRSTAFRLLLEQKNEKSQTFLKERLETGKLAESRVRALSLLHVLRKLKPDDLLVSLADEHAGIRAYAVQISHDLLDLDDVRTALIGMADDPMMAVRFQVALALGSTQNAEALKGLASIASRDGADAWSRAAILSGIGGRVSEFLELFQAMEVEDREAYAAVMQDLGRMIGQGVDGAAFRRLLNESIRSAEPSGWRIATALGLMQGLVARSTTPAADLWKQSTASLKAEVVTSFLRFCASEAQDSTSDLSDRANAVALLGYSPSHFGLPRLREVLSNPTEPDLQLQAVLALGIVEVEAAAEILVAEELWSAYTPKIRASVISQLVGNDLFIGVLVDAIDQGVVKAGQIPSSDRKRLMNSKDDSIRTRAEAVFKDLEGGDRMKVYQDYQSVLDTPGIAANGQAVFLKICSACHSYGGEGGNVGPDLSGMKNQPADALLLHTIVPNYEVYPMYQATMVETKGGQNLAGWIKAETENSITLRTAYGSDENILRSNIKSIHNSGRSLMPDGLEQTISREEIRHLISYLKSGGENPL